MNGYSLKYTLDFSIKPKHGFTREEVLKEKAGGCDALVFVSIIREGDEPHTGAKSFMVGSVDGFQPVVDGQPQQIPMTELFQAMMALASQLQTESQLHDWQRNLCRWLLDVVRDRLAHSGVHDPLIGEPQDGS